jgi:hypothetical protein
MFLLAARWYLQRTDEGEHSRLQSRQLGNDDSIGGSARQHINGACRHWTENETP